MTTKTPLFSIVIPTRNRAHLLPHALRSALNQQFEDYEIVVVANDCQDNTREVVHNMSTSRVHYFETEKTLPMPDNWEFAWTKARGKYVTYLCDDDALAPSALKLLAESLDGNPPVISWEDAIYYYPNWNDKSLQNILLLFFYGDTLVEDIDAKKMNQELSHFNFAWSSPIPKLLNCAANREFFEEWRQRLGRLFFPIAPDYSFAWISTQVCSFIRVIHRPLSLRGISDYSIGSNAGLGEAANTFFKEFGEFNFFNETQNNLPLSMNHLAGTFLRINPALANCDVKPNQLDSTAFFLSLAKQLLESRQLLTNWDTHAHTLLEKAKQLSPELHEQINVMLSQQSIEPAAQSETVRAIHQRTRTMALDFLPNLESAMKKYAGDVQCALCSLALRDEILTDAQWSYLYLFGECLGATNIYEFSTHIDRYYDLLLECRKKNCGSIEPEKSAANFLQNKITTRITKIKDFYTKIVNKTT